jgi:hypothetical protein
MGRAKRYKVTFQLECTVRAENQREAHEIAEAFASGQGMPGFQREIRDMPRSRPVPPPECAGQWTIINVAEIGPDDP